MKGLAGGAREGARSGGSGRAAAVALGQRGSVGVARAEAIEAKAERALRFGRGRRRGGAGFVGAGEAIGDAASDSGIGDAGDEAEAAVAAGAGEDVEVEAAAHHVGPQGIRAARRL